MIVWNNAMKARTVRYATSCACCFILLAFVAAEYAVAASDEKNAADGAPREIGSRAPKTGEAASPLRIAAIDFVVPGGGALYYKNYYYGALFGVLKIAGICAMYYSYNDWRYQRSLYFAAKRANAELDPDHKLRFKVPGGGYKTVEELHHDYDRSAQNITFAVLGTAAVYAASLIYTLYKIDESRERSLPTFEISYGRDILTGTREYAFSLGCTLRM